MKKNFKRIIGSVLSFALVLGVFSGCSTEEENDDQLAAIQKSGKIVVAVEGTYPPFTYHDTDSNELIGLDIEIAQAIGEKLGVEVEFVEGAWDTLLAGVQSGRFDTVINAVTATDERKETLDFSDPYLYIPREIIVKGDNDEIKSADDLDGKVIATNATNVIIPYAEEHGATLAGIDTSGEAVDLILSGRADFTCFTPLVLKSYLDAHPDADLKVAYVIPGFTDPVAIPIRKGEDRLREAINEALNEMREDGTLSAICVKYAEYDYTNKAEE
ncbi:MAG: transporter substrate-binding domain-containing protein [Eubacterium sp.]|nr:transporter substrate-binding domain-containing protein [Eubacterium sp.]